MENDVIILINYWEENENKIQYDRFGNVRVNFNLFFSWTKR